MTKINKKKKACQWSGSYWMNLFDMKKLDNVICQIKQLQENF